MESAAEVQKLVLELWGHQELIMIPKESQRHQGMKGEFEEKMHVGVYYLL